MEVAFVNILPLIVIFFLGMALKACGVFEQNDAQRFLKLFFYVSLPALILLLRTLSLRGACLIGNTDHGIVTKWHEYPGFFLDGKTGYGVCRRCRLLGYVAGDGLDSSSYLLAEVMCMSSRQTLP